MKWWGLRVLLLINQLVLFCEGRNGCPKRHPPLPKLCRTQPLPLYRPIDGEMPDRCSNPGRVNESYYRIDEAYYQDCVWEIRRSASNEPLPNARGITNKVFRKFQRYFDRQQPIPNLFSAMLGQYIAHDMSHRVDSVKFKNVTSECCATSLEDRHPSCIPIEIPRNDPDYSILSPSVNCLPVIRSKLVSKQSHLKEPRNQVNEATAYLDNSNLYGSQMHVNEKLKSGIGGRIITNKFNILPETSDGKYFLGDPRLNQTPQLQMIHSLFLREHNRIADSLQEINPHWRDSRLYEEVRRIVIAQYQHLIYEEFLPVYVDKENVQKVEKSAFNSRKDVVTFNEFVSGPFRIFHAFIPTQLHLISENGTLNTFSLKSVINNLRQIRHHYEDIIRGLMMQPIQTEGYDAGMFSGLHLIKDAPQLGFDLAAIDVQRGRDHGLPPYSHYLEELTGSSVTEFNHLRPFMAEYNIRLLKSIYENVQDIDLYTGSILETPVHGKLMGATAQYMFYQQFRRLKEADPYFYTNPKSPNPFSTRQLNEIKKFTSGHLFCMNSDIDFIPQFPSIAPLDHSYTDHCDSLMPISLEPWRERRKKV